MRQSADEPRVPDIQCSCGATYTRAQWAKLPYVGEQDDFDGGVVELRNCACGSTRAIQLPTGTDAD